MQLHLPTNLDALREAGKRLSQLIGDAAFYISNETDNDATRANDIRDGRKRLDSAVTEMVKVAFTLQLLNALQFAREGKWQEAYAQIEAATDYSRGVADLMQAWSLVKCQVDFMRVEAGDGPQQEG